MSKSDNSNNDETAAASFAKSLLQNKIPDDEPKESPNKQNNKHNKNNKQPNDLSKRQRRQQVNERQKWPQQPRIMNPAQRARAYLRVAGLEEHASYKIKPQTSKKQTAQKQQKSKQTAQKSTTLQKKSMILDPELDMDDPALRFGRLLADPNQRTRHQAVLMLRMWLKAKCAILDDNREVSEESDEEEESSSSESAEEMNDHNNNNTNEATNEAPEEDENEKEDSSSSGNASPPRRRRPRRQPTNGISALDLLKMWKALWHTLYMADKVPVQNELARVLSGLVWSVAGTPEEDEFAGQAYLNMYADGRVGFDDDNDDEDDEEEDSDDEDSEAEEESSNNDTDSSSSTSEGDLDDQQDELIKRADDEEEESSDEDDDVYQDEDAYDAKDFEDMSDGEEDGDSVDEDVVIHGIVNNDDDDESGEEESSDEDNSDDEIDEKDVKHCRGAHLATLFIKTFFMTVRREWGRMDKYRVDKFYTLMRLVMRQIYRYMALRHWNLGIIRLFNDAIYEEILSQKPNGLRYHLIDIALPELVHAAVTTGTEYDQDKMWHPEGEVLHRAVPLTEATFIDCMEPFLAMAQTGAGGDDTVHARVLENILVRFLKEYSVMREDMLDSVDNAMSDSEDEGDNIVSEDEDDEEKKGIPTVLSDVHVGTIAQFIFDLASDQDTKDSYRKALYNLHKKYMKRIKYYPTLEVDLQASESDEDDMDRQQDEDSMDETEEEDDGVVVRQVFVDENGQIIKPEDADEEASQESSDSKEDEPSATSNVSNESSNAKQKRKRESEESVNSLDKTMHESTAKKSKRQDERTQPDDKAESKDKQPKTTKRKNKKKKGKAADTAKEEEEIVISVSDQKSAKEKAKAAKKPTVEKKGKEKTDAPAKGKRVKFGAVNRARSHKASMKALRNSTPRTPPAKPELSILSKKPKHSKMGRISITKTNRKKAKDYF